MLNVIRDGNDNHELSSLLGLALFLILFFTLNCEDAQAVLVIADCFILVIISFLLKVKQYKILNFFYDLDHALTREVEGKSQQTKQLVKPNFSVSDKDQIASVW